MLLIAVLLFQIKILHLFMSPVVPVVAAGVGILPASLVVYAILFISSLFLGRAFCGWFCPGAGMQEILSLLIGRRAKRGWGDRIKYAICGVWSFLVLGVALRAGGFRQIDLDFGLQQGGLLQEVLMRTGHFVIIGVLGVIFGAWASCRYTCWIAPFLVLGNRLRCLFRLPGMRMYVEAGTCSGCEQCRDVCPMRVDMTSISSAGSIRNDDCIMCGNCVDVCPSQAIHFKWSLK